MLRNNWRQSHCLEFRFDIMSIETSDIVLKIYIDRHKEYDVNTLITAAIKSSMKFIFRY